MRFARWYWAQNRRAWRVLVGVLRPFTLEVLGLLAVACMTLPWLVELPTFLLVEVGIVGLVSGWGFGSVLGERISR